jgi:hypothetical protein
MNSYKSKAEDIFLKFQILTFSQEVLFQNRKGLPFNCTFLLHYLNPWRLRCR